MSITSVTFQKEDRKVVITRTSACIHMVAKEAGRKVADLRDTHDSEHVRQRMAADVHYWVEGFRGCMGDVSPYRYIVDFLVSGLPNAM